MLRWDIRRQRLRLIFEVKVSPDHASHLLPSLPTTPESSASFRSGESGPLPSPLFNSGCECLQEFRSAAPTDSRSRRARPFPACRQEVAIQPPQAGSPGSLRPRPGQTGRVKRRCAAGSGTSKVLIMGAVLPPAVAHGLHEFFTPKRAEERKRVFFSVFLPHEQKRQVGRQQEIAGGEPLFRRRVQERVEPIAAGPIADLVVVLQTDDESVAGQPLGRAPCLRSR